MNRLCFLFADIERVRGAVALLHAAQIGDSNIQVLARGDIPLTGLPTANIDATDALPGLKRGAVIGVIVGAVTGTLIMRFTELGASMGAMSILLFALMGAVACGFGTMLSGSAFFSSRLETFHEEIKAGNVLLMADVGDDRRNEVERLVKTRFPDAKFLGVEPSAPAVPPSNPEPHT
jgi:hypothetical protein